MAYYPIKDIGKIGVVTDLSPTDLPPNAFTDALNARFVGSQVQKFGGNKPITYNGPEKNLVAYAIQPMPFDFQYDHPFNILGAKDGLYMLEDQHWENISYWEPITSGRKTAVTTIVSHPLMTAINFVDNQINVKTGQSYDIYVTLTPDNVKKQDLTWSVTDPGLGSIVVDPHDPLHVTFTAKDILGSTTVSASNKDGSLTNFVFVSVIANVDSLTPNQSAYNIRRGDTLTATPVFYPAPPTDHDVIWISSDTTVFDVDANTGLITPHRVGSADLTVQLKNSPNVKGKSRVNVLAGVTSVQLVNPTNHAEVRSAVTIAADATAAQFVEVEVIVGPAQAPDKSWQLINYTNNRCANVYPKGGAYPNILVVSPIKAGSDIFQVVANDGGVLGTLQVTVSPAGSPAPAPDEPDDGQAGESQNDDPGDVMSFSVDLNLIPAQAPPVPAPVAAVVGTPPFPPKDRDGTLRITENLEEKYQHTLKENFDVEITVTGGTAPYEYHWYKDNVLTSISAPAISFSISDPAQAADYQVVVTDASGLQVASNIAEVYHYDDTVPQSVISVSVEPTAIDFNQGEKQKITSKVRVNDGHYDRLIYKWVIAKDGVITHDGDLNGEDLTVYGLGDGSTTVTLQVYPTAQKTFHVLPENNWYHTTIANCAVFNTNTFTPVVKEFGNKYFRTLPGWGEQTEVDANGNWKVVDRNWHCERIRAFNNRLFAFNMTEEDEGGVERHFPQRLRWSNFATENKAPTLWDDLADARDPEDSNSAVGTLKALTNGYAGYIDLADTQGDIIDVFPLKDYLFVFTEFETYVGTPTMNAYQPMTFKKLFNDSGILAPGCVCEVEGSQFVVTQNDIIMLNGATKQSIAHSIVKDRIIEEISAVNPAATRVYLHSDKKEVWICYVAPGMPKNTWFNSKAAVWNYEFQTWTFYELPHTYEIVLSDPPTLDKTATWDDYNPIGSAIQHLQPDGKPLLAGLTWADIDGNKQPWQKNFLNFRKRITLACSAMKGLYEMDIGSYTWAALNTQDPDNMTPLERPLKMWAERRGIDFDNLTEDWRQKHINAFNFQVNGTGTMQVDVGGTQYSNERGHQHNYRDYIAGRTRTLSVRLNHPYLYYAVVDEDPLSQLHISGLTIDFALGGRR